MTWGFFDAMHITSSGSFVGKWRTVSHRDLLLYGKWSAGEYPDLPCNKHSWLQRSSFPKERFGHYFAPQTAVLQKDGQMPQKSERYITRICTAHISHFQMSSYINETHVSLFKIILRPTGPLDHLV